MLVLKNIYLALHNKFVKSQESFTTQTLIEKIRSGVIHIEFLRDDNV